MAIAVLEKSFSVLEALSRAEGPTPLAELAAQTRLPKPTIYRILKTLLALGYVGQERSLAGYFLTSRMANLGQPDAFGALRERARPIMEELLERFNETVNLGVLESVFVRYIEVLETSQSLRQVVAPRSRDAFYSTAIGRALVAFLPETERERLLRSVELKALTPKTITDRHALRTELDDTLKRGWSREQGENDLGVICFGAPLLDQGRPVAAISITIPTIRVTTEVRKNVVAALRAIHSEVAREKELLHGRPG